MKHSKNQTSHKFLIIVIEFMKSHIMELAEGLILIILVIIILSKKNPNLAARSL